MVFQLRSRGGILGVLSLPLVATINGASENLRDPTDPAVANLYRTLCLLAATCSVAPRTVNKPHIIFGVAVESRQLHLHSHRSQTPGLKKKGRATLASSHDLADLFSSSSPHLHFTAVPLPYGHDQLALHPGNDLQGTGREVERQVGAISQLCARA